MEKRVSKKWLEEYFSLDLRDLKGGYFLQTDGGRTTWDHDRPKEKRAIVIHKSPSKVYWWVPPQRVRVLDLRACGQSGYMLLEDDED